MKFRISIDLDVDDTAYFVSVDEDSHEADMYLFIRDLFFDFDEHISVTDLEVDKVND